MLGGQVNNKPVSMAQPNYPMPSSSASVSSIASSQPNHGVTGNNFYSGGSPTEESGMVSHKLFEKMKDAVETEFKKQKISSQGVGGSGVSADLLVQQKLEGILRQELMQHTCPQCYELMRAPLRAPMMLVPCGHTFCSSCIETHATLRAQALGTRLIRPVSSSNAPALVPDCPSCGMLVESQTFNRPNAEMLRALEASSGGFSSDDVSNAARQLKQQQGGVNTSSNNARPSSAAASHVSGMHAGASTTAPSATAKDLDKFQEALKTSTTRVRILEDEVAQRTQEQQDLQREEQEQASRVLYLEQTQEQLQKEMDKLKARLEMTKTDLETTKANLQGSRKAIGEVSGKLVLVQKSLETAKRENQKYQILVRESEDATEQARRLMEEREQQQRALQIQQQQLQQQQFAAFIQQQQQQYMMMFGNQPPAFNPSQPMPAGTPTSGSFGGFQGFNPMMGQQQGMMPGMGGMPNAGAMSQMGGMPGFMGHMGGSMGGFQ